MKRVLVVDDDAEICGALGDILHNEGYEVTLVSDGDEAIHALRDARFDVVLLDIIMPRVNGYEVIEWASAHGVSADIIIMSASHEPPQGIPHLLKPFDIDDLLALMRGAPERDRGDVMSVTSTVKETVLSCVERVDGHVIVVWNRAHQCWGLPGGKVEAGETLAEAQARELREETGCVATSAELIYRATSRTDSERLVHVFRAHVQELPLADEWEVEPGSFARWAPRDFLICGGGTFAPFYREMFRALSWNAEGAR